MCFTGLPGDSHLLSWRLMKSREGGTGDKMQRHNSPSSESGDCGNGDFRICSDNKRDGRLMFIIIC